jgi:hypothetical protein
MAPSRPRQPKKTINRKTLLVQYPEGTNLHPLSTRRSSSSTFFFTFHPLTLVPLVPSPVSLPALPSELLQKIFSNLDQVSSVCLSLTSRNFYAQYHERDHHDIVPLWRGYWERQRAPGAYQVGWRVKPLYKLIARWIGDGEQYYFCMPRMKFVSIERRGIEW